MVACTWVPIGSTAIGRKSEEPTDPREIIFCPSENLGGGGGGRDIRGIAAATAAKTPRAVLTVASSLAFS